MLFVFLTQISKSKSKSKFDTLLRLDNYFHTIPNVLSLELIPFGSNVENSDINSNNNDICKRRLIERIPDSVCCYILQFLTFYETSHVILKVSKYWRNELLTDLNTFMNLWNRVVLGNLIK